MQKRPATVRATIRRKTRFPERLGFKSPLLTKSGIPCDSNHFRRAEPLIRCPRGIVVCRSAESNLLKPLYMEVGQSTLPETSLFWFS
jgi:hypothetical protein